MLDVAPLVLRTDLDAVATLTLNAPDKLNAISAAMIQALAHAFKALATDTSVRVVILAAAGSAFSAGHDLKELNAAANTKACEAIFCAGKDLMLQIAALPQPVIAKVHGLATAGGCQLVAQCDLAIASTAATFATSSINLGLFSAMPAVPITRAIGAKAAAELLYTGRAIPAAHAARIGLINRAVGAEILDVEVANLALEIASKPPQAIAKGKAVLRAQANLSLADAYTQTTRAMTDAIQTQEARAGIEAFLEKRPLPVWKDRTAAQTKNSKG